MPPLDDENSVLIRKMETDLTKFRSQAAINEAYYDGAMRLEALGLSLPPEMRQLQTVVNWPRLYVDSIEERLDVEGFRIADNEKTEDRLWTWWQNNDMDEESTLGHREALIHGHSFICVGKNEDDPETPLFTVESATSMIARLDPRTRIISSAARFYERENTTTGRPRRATLYLPDTTYYLARDKARMSAPWDVEDVDPHAYGEVPVAILWNQQRLKDRRGRTEMADVMQITDAACRALTNLQGAQEFYAVPTRYVFGVTDEDFKDQNGKPLTFWEAYLGRFNTLASTDANVSQLPASDLNNFGNVLQAYSKLIASVTGLPPHYLGYTSDNPSSADAIRSSEARLVKKCERRQRGFSGGHERAMRLGALVVDGRVPEPWKRLETVWSDPATPTFAAKAQMVLALVKNGLLPREQGLAELGYGPEKRKEIEAQFRGNDPLQELLTAGLRGGGGGEELIGGRLGRDADSDGIRNEPR